MDLDYFQQKANNIKIYWSGLSKWQKNGFAIAFALAALFCFAWEKSSQASSGNGSSPFLDTASSPIKDNPRETISSKTSQSPEIWNSPAWMKGDKELQALELRGLKDQLEQDLSLFEGVKSAAVVLEVPAVRPLATTLEKPKASVILTLTQDIPLTLQKKRAIALHVASAVPGLSLSGITISDTTGRVYRPDEKEGLEETIQQKAEEIVSLAVGKTPFFVSLQIAPASEGRKKMVFLRVFIDHTQFSVADGEANVRSDLERQLTALLKEMGQEGRVGIETANFTHSPTAGDSSIGQKEVISALKFPWLYFSLFCIIVAVMAGWVVWQKFFVKRKIEEKLIADSVSELAIFRKLALDFLEELEPDQKLEALRILEKMPPERLSAFLKAQNKEVRVYLMSLLSDQQLDGIDKEILCSSLPHRSL